MRAFSFFVQFFYEFKSFVCFSASLLTSISSSYDKYCERIIENNFTQLHGCWMAVMIGMVSTQNVNEHMLNLWKMERKEGKLAYSAVCATHGHRTQFQGTIFRKFAKKIGRLIVFYLMHLILY